MRPERHQPVALELAQGRLRRVVESELAHGRLAVRRVAREERGIGLQQEQAAIQGVRLRGRKKVVLVHRGATGHVTIALPWCQDGS